MARDRRGVIKDAKMRAVALSCASRGLALSRAFHSFTFPRAIFTQSPVEFHSYRCGQQQQQQQQQQVLPARQI